MTTKATLYGICPKCNNRFYGENGVPKFCGKCGASTITACPKCQTALSTFEDDAANYCESCGNQLQLGR